MEVRPLLNCNQWDARSRSCFNPRNLRSRGRTGRATAAKGARRGSGAERGARRRGLTGSGERRKRSLGGASQ
eukprot:6393481-Alexandrium_andersonii.AAC.1